ncbi:hypothetical protein DQ04_06611040 [Trypanosoma grayi]|uniref:hypothetical protein n=1 Tax=Trypanosoma grayi TaxID=71804 RepID=UPI0004F3EF37|nr:hypothetical protein DQ04_06611040 [Trypanosoma grayi]KEG08705.1 hypothetical protein DQ04_06611040 [Trypanosoma grayi]
MMAAVVRPALFVVAVVLCCVCGCAAATAEGIGDEEQVIVALQNARKKALDAQDAVIDSKKAVDAIKEATDSFKSLADKASNAAAELHKKVKGMNDGETNIAGVDSLAKTAMDAAKASHESVTSIEKNVNKAVGVTTNAGKLLTESERMAGSAAAGEKVVISREAGLVQAAFKRLLDVLSVLKEVQNRAEEATSAATKDGAAFNAMGSGEKAYKCATDTTSCTLSAAVKQLKTIADEAVTFTKAAADHAETASSAAIKASGHAANAVSSAESQLQQITATVKVLKPRKKEPAEPSHDESNSQSLPQVPSSSTSTGDKPSDQQQADTTATHTTQSTSVPSEEKTATESLENAASQAADAPLTPPKSDVQNTLSDARNTDSSVCPPWARTPLLLVVGVLGVLAVC